MASVERRKVLQDLMRKYHNVCGFNCQWVFCFILFLSLSYKDMNAKNSTVLEKITWKRDLKFVMHTHHASGSNMVWYLLDRTFL